MLVQIKKTLKDKYTWNPVTCSCKNGSKQVLANLASITDDSVITCDEIIEKIKQLQQNFIVRKVACKTQNFYILLPFSIITIIKNFHNKNIYYHVTSQMTN